VQVPFLPASLYAPTQAGPFLNCTISSPFSTADLSYLLLRSRAPCSLLDECRPSTPRHNARSFSGSLPLEPVPSFVFFRCLFLATSWELKSLSPDLLRESPLVLWRGRRMRPPDLVWVKRSPYPPEVLGPPFPSFARRSISLVIPIRLAVADSLLLPWVVSRLVRWSS